MAELEMDLSVPLLETALPERMPMRFRKLLDSTIPIPESVRFEEYPLLRQFELRLFLISQVSFVLGLLILTVGIAGVFDWIETGLTVAGLVVLMGLAVLFVALGFLLSATSAKRLRKAQGQGTIRLGNFYCEDALLQNHGNYVNLIPKNRFVGLVKKPGKQKHTADACVAADTEPFYGSLVYKGAFDRVQRLSLGGGADTSAIAVGDLEKWAGCQVGEN